MNSENSIHLVVVAAVGDQAVWPPARSTTDAGDRWHRVEKRNQLRDVVAVAARDREGERDPRLVDEEMMLGARPTSVHGARARLGAPFFACTWLESAIARDHSISPAARRRARSKPQGR